MSIGEGEHSVATTKGVVGPSRRADLVHGGEREQAYNTHQDQAGFNDAGGNKAEREGLVLPLDDREQCQGGADASQRDDHLKEGAPAQTAVAA